MDKKNRKRLILVLFVTMLQAVYLYGQETPLRTIKEQMEQLQVREKINFTYDSALNINIPYKGKPLNGLSLTIALKELFAGTGITWQIEGKYVLLFALRAGVKKYTVSGYIYQKSGESLVNATIMNLTSNKGTLSNAYGFFSMTLPEGKHKLRFSYVGYKEQMKDIEIDKNSFLKIYLEESPFLQEVVVIGDLNSPLHTTQTGKVTLTPEQLNTEFSLLSSPDLIKTLQNIPGVASGTEMISGLYVHGGTNDGNLFLLDGTPLYQVNHLGGLFSAFNTDIVKNVDFYKSGFPARYGGRLSSVVDVRTKDGNMKEYHGSFSLGLLDGRIQFEGPIIKDRTSFNIGIRRSWADLFTAAAFGMYNSSQNETNLSGRYAFHDINAKITHRFSDKSKVYASFYSGNDMMRLKNHQELESFMADADKEYNKTNFKLQWGNMTTSINWNYQLSSKLFSNFTAVYSRNKSLYGYMESNRYTKEDKDVSVKHMERQNNSIIDDMGYRMEFDYRPTSGHHIRFGSNYLHHAFRPQSNVSLDFSGGAEVDTLSSKSAYSYGGNEFTLYAEDDIQLFEKLKANIGLHYTLFKIQSKTYHSLEPRLALKYQWSNQLALKVSYTEMSQFVHLLSNTYLNLPTDYWVPSTQHIRPKRSRQIAGGIYAKLPHNLHLAVEGYYTIMNHLIEYDGGNSLTPSVTNWEDLVKIGKGKAYGAELSLSYVTPKISLDASYTLSWSKRKFTDFYPQWYADKFDNRHKFNISGRYQFSRRIDAYARWTFHSGDKATMPTQYVNGPTLPGIVDPLDPGWIYEKPNNVTLPSYHRLDVGANFRHTTKRGYERIWNVSIYNVYSRMNALYGTIEHLPDGKFRGKATGIFPIIPSFSYTLKF